MTYHKEKRSAVLCDETFCGRFAEWIVKDNYGNVKGKYCGACSSERVDILNRAEEATQAKNGSE